jgi:hypothetical protein
MDYFRAGVQYGDWHGTAAADNTDFKDRLHDHLEKEKLIRPGEFLIAVSLWVGEGSTYIHAYLFEGALRYEDVVNQLDTIRGPIPVREVSIEMSLQEFLKSFKRFNVMLTAQNLPLADREYSSHE